MLTKSLNWYKNKQAAFRLPVLLNGQKRWFTVTSLVLIFILLPLASLIVYATFPDPTDSFKNISESVLSAYVYNSISVLLQALIFSAIIGIPTAWWCARYEFFGRSLITLLLVMPIAIPAYISAYIYTDLLDYSGAVQIFLRELFGWQSPDDYWSPQVRSTTGAGLMLALALYPYLFLVLSIAFSKQSESVSQAAKLMEKSAKRRFWGVYLPLARPAAAIGLTLIGMETVADYGTVSLFAIPTLTTGVYDSWLIYGSLTSAARLSCILLVIVMFLVWLEQRQRGRQRSFSSHLKTVQRKPASLKKQCFIWLYASLILLTGFFIPIGFLIQYVMDYPIDNSLESVLPFLKNSLSLSFWSSCLILFVGFLFAFYVRMFEQLHPKVYARLASLGYAIPGTVLAIGIIIPASIVEHYFNDWLISQGQQPIGLFISGTISILILAFCIRFSAISIGQIQAGYAQMPPNLDQAASILGDNRWQTFKKIHLPILWPSFVAILLLVFIESAKELPASLLLRPFNFETLPTFIFQHASDEQLEKGAIGALFIILISLIPSFFLVKQTKKV